MPYFGQIDSMLNNINHDNLSVPAGLLAGISIAAPINWLKPKLLKTGQYLGRWFQSRQEEPHSSDEDRYKEQLLAYVERHHLGSSLARLEEIYVEPRIIIPNSVWEQLKTKPGDASQLFELWPDLAGSTAVAPPPTGSIRQLLTEGERVIITGAAGAGKTTLLAYITLICCQTSPSGRYSSFGDRLPVFIHLAEIEDLDLVEVDSHAAREPLKLIAAVLSGRFLAIEPVNLELLLKSKYQQNRLLLLIDGWDELPADRLAYYVKWLDGFLTVYPDCQVIAAGPTVGFGPLTALDFVVSGLLPWRQGQAIAYGRAWLKLVGSNDPLSLELYWQPGQLCFKTFSRISLLLDAKDHPAANTFERESDMMTSSLKQLLSRLRLNSDDQWLAPAAFEFWQLLAFSMLNDKKLSISKEGIQEVANIILEAFLPDVNEMAIVKLCQTLEKSGLFVIYPDGKTSFLSPMWRDYLVALYLADSDYRDKAVGFLEDPYWNAVLKFLAGHVGAISLLSQLKQQGWAPSERDLFILAAWLPEALDRHHWRSRVLIGLGQIAIDANRPIALRQRAVATLALTGEKGVSDLLDLLLDKSNPSIRQVAIASYACIAPRKASLIAERMMENAEESVRVAAVHSMAWLDTEANRQPLYKALFGPDDALRKAAVLSFALNRTEFSKNALREAAMDEALSVRSAAVHGLSAIDEDWAENILEKLVQAIDKSLIKSAEDSRRTNGNEDNSETWQPELAGEQEWLINWAINLGEVVPVGAAAVPLVMKALMDKDPMIKTEAVRTLGALYVADAIQPLEQLIRDSNPQVKATAEYALGRLRRAWGRTPFRRGPN